MNAIALVDRVANRTGILRWMRGRCRNGLTVLMYHKVLPAESARTYPLRNLVVDSSSFAEQMAWLAGHFEVVTLREAVGLVEAGLDRRPRTSRPLACVSFDDGYLDNFKHAAPVLESCGLRGTFFVTTGFVSGTQLWFDRITLAWHRDAAAAVRSACAAAPEHEAGIRAVATFDDWWEVLKRLPAAALARVVATVGASGGTESAEVFGAMNPEQLRDLARRGHEIGSHAATHQLLTNLDDVSLHDELVQSRALIREWTGHDAGGVCYPNGDYDDRVIAAARTAGYRYGCGVGRGMADVASDRMVLPRRAILSSARGGSATERFESEVVGWHDALRRWRTQWA